MRKWLKKLGKVLGIFLGGVLLLVLLALLFLQTGPGKSVLQNQVVMPLVEGSLQGEVSVERIDGNLLTSAELHGVTVRDVRGNVAARVPQASASYSLLGLLSSQFEVDSLRLQQPLVVARMYDDGTLNLSTLSKPSEKKTAPSQFQLHLSDFAVEDGLVVYLDHGTLEGQLSEEKRAELDAWLEALDAAETTIPELREQAAKLLAGTTGEAPAALSAGGLDANGAFHLYGGGKFDARLEKLATRLHANTAAKAHDLQLDDLSVQRAPDHVEGRLARLEADGLVLLEELRGGVDFVTETDELGNKVVVSIEQLFAGLDRVTVRPALTDIVAPTAPLTGPITARGRVAGTLDALDMLVRVGCGETTAATLAGSVAFPGEDFSDARYDLAALLDEFEPSTCLDLQGRQVAASGALTVDGSGANPDTLEAQARLALRDTRIDDYELSALALDASADQGTFSVDRLAVLSPYAQLSADGSFGLDGQYRVDLRARANAQVSQMLEEFGGQQMQTEFARIDLSSKGQLDLEATSPLGYVEQGDLSVDWRLEGFDMEEYQIASSRGEISTSVSPVEERPNARRIEYDADLLARGLNTPPLSARLLDVEARGQGVLELPVDDLLASLRGLSTRWDARVRNLRTPTLKVGSADVAGQISRRGPEDAFRWELRGTTSDTRFQNNRVGQADFDLEGSARVRPGPPEPRLGRISAKGTADVRDLSAGDNSMGRGQLEIDVSGEFPDLRGQVGVEATDVTAAGEQVDRLDLDVQLQEGRRVDVSARAERAGDKAPISLEAEARYSPGFDEFTVEQFDLSGPDISLSVPEDATISLEDGGVSVDKLELRTDGQAISVEGTYRSRGKQDLSVELSNVRPSVLREKFDLQDLIPDVGGVLDGKLDIDGTARRPIISVDITFSEFTYQDYGPFSARLEGIYENEWLKVQTLRVDAADTKILTGKGRLPMELSLTGQFDVPRTRPMDLTIRIPKVGLERLHETMPILKQYAADGVVFANLYLSRTIRNPSIQLQFEGTNVGFAGDVGGSYVEISEITTGLKADYSPPKGNRGGITARYDLSWRGEKVVSARASTPMPLARWARQVLDEQRESPDWADAVAQLPFDLALEVKNLDLGEIPVKPLAEADAEGAIFIDLQGKGTFSQPQLSLDLRLDDFGWNQYRDIFVNAALELKNQVVTIADLRLEWDADEILVAQGEFPMPTQTLMDDEPLGDLPIELSAQLKKLPISKLSAIDYEFAKYEGILAGYLQASGTLAAPSIQGRAGIFDTELADGRNGTIALSFDAQNGRFEADTFICRSYDEILRGRASLPVNLDVTALAQGESLLAEGPIQASLKSDELRLGEIVPTELTKAYVSDIGGTMKVDLNVDGTWEEPRVTGDLMIQNGEITLPIYGRRFTDIALDVGATREKVSIDRVYVAEGDSWVRLDGTVELEGFSPQSLDATMESKEFNFGGFAEGFAAYATSTVEITGNFTGRADQITARATELEVTIPEGEGGDLHPTELDNEIIVLQRRAGSDQLINVDELLAQPDEEAGRQRPLQVRFIAQPGSWVRHPMADIEFKADITANLSGPNVSMLGSVDTIRGNAEVLGKTFEVPEQENAVRFTGASPPNPVLDVRALNFLSEEVTSEVGEPTEGEPRIIVRVRGRAQDPKLVLESDPAMTETEIIFVLMTGRPPTQAGAGEETSISGVALGAATGVFAGLLQERLSGALPVDVLRVQAGDEGFRDARLQVGKYINERVFLSYVFRFGAEEGEGANVVKIEYRFASRWKLVVQSSDQLTGQFKIFWDVY